MLGRKIANLEIVDEWAKVEKLFRCGRQGITGVLKTRTSPVKCCVFKLSQNIDYLVEHEYKVMNRLNDLASFCPHFCLVEDVIMCLVEQRLKKYKNPFDIISKNPIYKPVLIEEFIKGTKLGSYIDNAKNPITDLPILSSAIKQVMMGIAFAQNKCNFTHYDLHTDNIILEKHDSDSVFLYILDNNTAFAVPTNGYRARIIDYGFSYVDAADDDYLTTSLLHTDIGYTNDRFDWVSDPKLFLISISYQLKNVFPNSKSVKKFSNCVRNMFSNLCVDWEYGWDEYEDDSVTEQLLEEAEKDYRDTSFIFNKYKHDAIQVLQSVIKLPFTHSSYENLSLSYCTFLKEFSKIEDRIENTVHLFYILKAIIDSAKKLRDEYENEDTQKSAITKFRHYITEIIDSVAKFCSVGGLHYEKMLCALYSFEECASGFLYTRMKKRYNEKNKYNKSLPVRNLLDILNVLYYNCEDYYDYTSKTTIQVYDSVQECQVRFKLTRDEIKKLDEVEYWMKAPLLAQMYKERRELENELDNKNTEIVVDDD